MGSQSGSQVEGRDGDGDGHEDLARPRLDSGPPRAQAGSPSRRNNPITKQAQGPPKRGVRVMKRSRTGCLTCRARKIKCDEAPGSCDNCERCNLECRYPTVQHVFAANKPRPTTSSSAGSAGEGGRSAAGTDASAMTLASTETHSRRVACHCCRVARCRCSREQPKCSRCRELGLGCEYRAVAPGSPSSDVAQLPQPPPASVTPQPPAAQGLGLSQAPDVNCAIDHLSRNRLHQHIDVFFSHVYPCQGNGYIHRGTLLSSVQSRRVDRKLLLAICAVASRFMPRDGKETPRAFSGAAQARAWAKEAKTLLILEDMTVDTVATALLLAKNDIYSGNYGSAWMLSSIANRAALALGLDKVGQGHDNMSFVEQETRRRLFWSCYCLDRMMSTGVPEFAFLRAEHIRLQLPCEEHQYLLGIPCVTPVPVLEEEVPLPEAPTPEKLSSQSEIGPFGHHVQIMEMRYCILKYTRNHPEDPKRLPPWDPSSTFAYLVRKVSAWHRTLLPQFQLLPDTIYVRHAQNQLSPLIMIHVWYDQCMSDLYRIVMPGFPETLPPDMLLGAPPGWVQQHQSACVRHATNMAATFEMVAAHIDLRNSTLLDASLPICVFESIRVQLQWLFMLPPETLQDAMAACRERFEMLMGYVEGMTKYFRQAQWLLNEMHKMLRRHGIATREETETSNAEPPGAHAIQHPWQQRVQCLKDDTRGGETGNAPTAGSAQDVAAATRPTVLPAQAPNHIDYPAVDMINQPIDDASTDTFPQAPPFTFSDGTEMFQDDLAFFSGSWEGTQGIPSLGNSWGISGDGEWYANGAESRMQL